MTVNATDYVLPVYRRCETLMVRGEGMYLYDEAGHTYLDFAAGIATNALGHGHPAVVTALQTQAQQLWHCSNLFRNAPLEAFATLLAESSFADRIFFCSSGTEAVEAAIKTARRYHYAQGQAERTQIITVDGAFHGRTTGALAACSHAASREGFEPLMPGFSSVPFHDLEAMEHAITKETAAVMLETIQGEGGVREHSADYLQKLHALCDAQGVLLMLDEIQCGYGRTGHLFAFEEAGITPDICTIAKGMGGGFPLAAMLTTERAASGMTQGTHGSTYGSNPLACAVGQAVLTTILEPGFLEHVTEVGMTLRHSLETVVEKYPDIFDKVRGHGLMLGLVVQSTIDKHALNAAFREAGLLLAPAVTHVIRVVPPLILEASHIAEAETIIHDVCKGWQL